MIVFLLRNLPRVGVVAKYLSTRLRNNSPMFNLASPFHGGLNHVMHLLLSLLLLVGLKVNFLVRSLYPAASREFL